MADAAIGPNRDFLEADPLFRVLKKKKWLNLDKLPEAFMLGTGETGLSVCYNCRAEHAQTVANLDSEGVARLFHGPVTAINALIDGQQTFLTVVPDAPHHAEIQGIPHKEHDNVEAERLAGELARIAIVVIQNHYRRIDAGNG